MTSITLDIFVASCNILKFLCYVPCCRDCNLVVLTFETQKTSSPQYLSQHISLRTSARNTRSSSVPLLCVQFRRTSFARRSFSTAAPLTWNSLPPAVLNYESLSTFKSRLKTHLFSTAFCYNYSTYLFRQRLCSHLMALGRFINFILLLLLLLLLLFSSISLSRTSTNSTSRLTSSKWKFSGVTQTVKSTSGVGMASLSTTLSTLLGAAQRSDTSDTAYGTDEGPVDT